MIRHNHPAGGFTEFSTGVKTNSGESEMKEPWQTFTIQNILKMKEELTQAKDRIMDLEEALKEEVDQNYTAQASIKRLEGLVREMGKLFLSVVKMTCKSNQYAELFYDIDDRIYAVLNRPLVKEIMEKEDELAANERLAELASEDMA